MAAPTKRKTVSEIPAGGQIIAVKDMVRGKIDDPQRL